MDETQFTTYLKRHVNDIQAIARKLARRDQELYEDLVQEGRIALWGLDVRKAKDNEDAWIRQALYNRMVSFLRRDRRRPKMFDSLDALLERGAQVVEDSDGPGVVNPMSRRPMRQPDWDGPDEE